MREIRNVLKQRDFRHTKLSLARTTTRVENTRRPTIRVQEIPSNTGGRRTFFGSVPKRKLFAPGNVT